MASPISVGTTAIVAVPRRPKRAEVRFQNVGTTILYFKRKSAPSATDYEFSLDHTGGDPNEWNFATNSIDPFYVVSSGAAGSLAIFETVYNIH